MKRLIAMILCAAMILAIMPTAAFAYQPQPTQVMAANAKASKAPSISSGTDSAAKEFFTVLGENILTLLETPVSILITLFFLPETIINNIKDAIKYR